MKIRFPFFLFLLLLAAAHAQIVVDHTSVAKFDSIPAAYKTAAQDLRLFFMDRSVGGNISDALSCLSSPWASAASSCKRYQHRDSAYAVAPSEVYWEGVWSRSNWRYEYWPSNCSEDVQCFIASVEPRIDSFDVVGCQFSYLAVTPGSKIADLVDGFFGSKVGRNHANVYAAFAAKYPNKKIIWWTTSLARGIGSAESQAFNDQMRAYAKQAGVILFDVADILSHTPAGAPCYDNRDGVPYLTENYPDDGLNIPAICPQYTTETEGGHLGSISAGGIRVAKAFWVLMARIAGWDGGVRPDTTPLPSKVTLLEPANGFTVTTDTILFRWMKTAPSVTRYRVQIARDSLFQNIALLDSMRSDTTAIARLLQFGLKYFWRVQAKNTAGWGPFSDVWSFTIPMPPLFTATPLPEMGKSLYKGYSGGLYTNGSNLRPPKHNSDGVAFANAIVPLDTLGGADPVNGKIVLLSVGMSNCTQEYSAFVALTDTFRMKNPSLVVVDGAQGGQTASVIKDPAANFWTIIERQRLPAKRVHAKQVQAIWLKEANAGPTQAFPTHATMLKSDLKQVATFLLNKYPNLKLVYLSSRTYGGYATTTLNPEPYAYETGFSVQWLIDEQIKGDSALSYSSPQPRAPWLAWGPYLWGSGETPRWDGLIWSRDDFGNDGTHPTDKGRAKVARLLLEFFSTDETTTPWFLKKSSTAITDVSRPQSRALRIAPNPAADEIFVDYSLTQSSDVRIDIVNALGISVFSSSNDEREAGTHTLKISLKETRLTAGVYFVRMSANDQVVSEKFIIAH